MQVKLSWGESLFRLRLWPLKICTISLINSYFCLVRTLLAGKVKKTFYDQFCNAVRRSRSIEICIVHIWTISDILVHKRSKFNFLVHILGKNYNTTNCKSFLPGFGVLTYVWQLNFKLFNTLLSLILAYFCVDCDK